MSDQSDEKNQNSKNRGVKGLHRLPLKDTFEIAEAVLELGQGDPVAPVLVLDHLKRTPGTGTSTTLLGASSTYGLTKSVGKKLVATDRAITILDQNSSMLKRKNAEYDALFSDEMFSGIVAKYTDKTLPPLDDVVHDYLKQTYKLSDSDAKTFWKVTKKNLSDFGLLKELSTGKKIVISREQALTGLTDELEDLDDNLPDVEQEQLPTEDNRPTLNNSKVNTANVANIPVASPEFHFNIQIHLPADASPDQYDVIFKSIAVNLLGRTQDDK